MATRTIGSKSSLFCRKGGIGAVGDVLKAFVAPGKSRSMATEVETSISSNSHSIKVLPAEPPTQPPFAYRKPPTVLATIYRFPSLEPTRFESFPTTFLYAPLRRDILHRAIVFEGDSHRLGLASTKWRREVHGSSHKLRPQKGTGRARLGDRDSPMLRGGGVAHGPKPRDFSTKLPRQIYDLAWRTALSYRYRRGQLVVVEDELEISEADPGLALSIMKQNGWGNEHQRSLLITAGERPNLKKAMGGLGAEGRVLTKEEVDVKDVLEMGRIVVEREALLWFQKIRSERR